MDDEDVIFEGSPLYEHLLDAGIDGFNCEKKLAAENPGTDDNDDGDVEKTKDGAQLEKIGWWPTLKCSLYNYVYDESWHKQVKSLHKRSCNHIIDASIKKQVLYEDDAAYVESFASSLSERTPQVASSFSDSLYGQMFLQVAVLCVTIGYGLLRMFYAKSGPSVAPLGPPKSSSSPSTQQSGICCSVLIYGLDFLSLTVIVAALLPVTVKFSSVGRLVGRLDSFTGCFDRLMVGLENLRRASARGVLFVQEAEVIKRGYTLVTVPVSRLELGLNSCGQRECLDLRRSIFHRNRIILLAIRKASLSLLKLFPDNVELKGIKQCLASRALRDFSDYLDTTKDHHQDQVSPSNNKNNSDVGDDGDGEVFKLTDGYSLASLKFLMELTSAHVSELVRLISLLSLIRTNELSTTGNDVDGNSKKSQGFSDLTSIVSNLASAIDRNSTPLEQCLAMAQTIRNRIAEGNGMKEDKRRKASWKDGESSGKVAIRGIHVAMHSLKLHLESALRRVQSHDDRLETFLDNDEDNDGDDNDGGNDGSGGGDGGDDNNINGDGSQKEGAASDGAIEDQAPQEKASRVSTKYAKMMDEISSEAKQLGRELKAGKECLEELEMIVTKLFRKAPKPSGNDQSGQSRQKADEDSQKRVHLVVVGTEPTIEDEFFEGVSGKCGESKLIEDEEELESLRMSRKDAARVMSELRSVISVRAKDMEERERKAFLKKFNHDLPDVGGQPELPATSNGRTIGDSFQSPVSSDLRHSVNGRHSPLPGRSEEGFNGARPKESLKNLRSRKDRQYFRDRAESSDSDEGNVSSNHHPPKGTHLRHRRPLAKTSPSNESSCGAASLETSYSRDPESEDSNGTNGLFGFRQHQHHSNDVEPFGGGVCNSDFQAPLIMKGLADMAASLSRRVNLGEEDLFGNDDVDEDDDDVVGHDDDDEEEEEESEVNDVSESQSDLDSDDIYHVTDDDEGFDGVNVGYDDDDDEDK